jgi:L-ascorbate metabolism protein UlaG (beta-lactamase superfamily)
MPQLHFFGHSAVQVTHEDTKVVIDPFLTGNGSAAVTAGEIEATAIILTHAHNDHMGDTVAIAQRTGAAVVAIYELAAYLGQKGLETHGMSIGGAHQFPWGWVKLTQAWHGSTFQDENGQLITLGTPAGVLLRLGEKLLYHAGDTGLFGDMALIGRAGIDVALLPIGDNFTMGPDDALEAVKLLNPKTVVPIHYNTFPVIEQDAQAWKARVEAETQARCVVLDPGQTLGY